METTELTRDDEMARSSDPAYIQTCGRVPKELVDKWKIACIKLGVNQSEAMEEAINLWLKIKFSEESDRHET